MKNKDTLLSKESLKKAISTIGMTTYTLIYDGNDTDTQIKAGKQLLQAKWILATFCDHVYDYYPISYFMNDDERQIYPDFLKEFMGTPEELIQNSISYVKNNFSILETISRDEYNQHRIPIRKPDEEQHVLDVLKCVQNNLPELLQLLKLPKKVSDPNKPTEIEIKELIEAITNIQEMYNKYADKTNDSEITLKIFQFNKFLEMYKCPLYMAWQTYCYGWHSDFWNEGDSMFEYMMFESQSREIIGDLIKNLEENSPFSQFEQYSHITTRLLCVYRHLLTQNIENI